MPTSPRPTAPARRVLTPSEFVGGYGPDWTRGVLSEHLESFVKAGGTWKRARSGSGQVWAIVEGKAYSFVCSEIVPIDTEDGVVAGRCGQVATVEGSCEHHAEQRAFWRTQTDAEVAQWERDREGLARTA